MAGSDRRTRPGITHSTTRGAARVMAAVGYPPVSEIILANRRRVDLVGAGPDGRIMITEVKSCPADYVADSKWPEYLGYSDYFLFAVPPDFPIDLLDQADKCGIIVADGFDGAVIRPAPQHSLSAARRKSMLCRLARQAAMRFDYCGNHLKV